MICGFVKSLPWPIEIHGSKLYFYHIIFLSQYCAEISSVCRPLSSFKSVKRSVEMVSIKNSHLKHTGLVNSSDMIMNYLSTRWRVYHGLGQSCFFKFGLVSLVFCLNQLTILPKIPQELTLDFKVFEICSNSLLNVSHIDGHMNYWISNKEVTIFI